MVDILLNIWMKKLGKLEKFRIKMTPFTAKSYNSENGSINYCLSHHNLGITGKVTKWPGVLPPHQVDLARQH